MDFYAKNPRFISPNATMIEVIITANGGNTPSSTPFADQQQLVNRPIVAIEAFCDTDMAFSPFNAGVPVIPAAALKSAFLNVQRSGKLSTTGKDGLYYRYIPLTRLRVMFNNDTALTPLASSARDLFQVNPMFFSWPDSAIMFPTSTSMGASATWSVPLLIHYLLENEEIAPYHI